jgi:hypothetical protein
MSESWMFVSVVESGFFDLGMKTYVVVELLIRDCSEWLFFRWWMRVVYIGRQRGLREIALRLGTFLLAHAEDHCMLDVLHVLGMVLLVHGERS